MRKSKDLREDGVRVDVSIDPEDAVLAMPNEQIRGWGRVMVRRPGGSCR